MARQWMEKWASRIGAALPRTLSFARMGIQHKLTVLLYGITLVSVGIIGLYGYYHASNAYRSKAVDLTLASTVEASNQIGNFLTLARSDLVFVSQFYAMRRFLFWESIGDEEKMAYWREIAADTVLNFMEAYDYHYKIRLFNQAGVEKVTVRRDPVNASVRKVGEEELQDMSGQDFFRQSLKLQRDQLHVSPIDFNTEHGKVEKPLIPVLRMTAPLIGEQGEKYGFVGLALFANSLFATLREANKNSFGLRFYLIDGKGNFLFHPDGDRAFGHLLGHGANFDQEHHNLMADFRGQTEGSIIRGGHIHSFKLIQPDPGQQDLVWYVVGVVDESTAMAELNIFIGVFLALVVLVVLGVMLGSRYMVKELMTPLQFVTRQMQRLGRGEAEPEAFDYPADDEIHDMLESSERVVTNLQRMARQADAIAGGDLSGQVETLSEHDRLGNALNNMTRQLAANHLADDQRNWLNDGLAQLNRALAGDLSPQQLAEEAISQLARYLRAGRGVFYVWQEEQEILELIGSYMYTERNALGAQVRPGQGAVGQVARERKPIILNLGESDTQPAPITTGTTSQPPQHTYTWPLLREGALFGVLEIACNERLGELETGYLNDAAEIIASFLHATLQRERIRNLLTVAEEATRQAQEQSRQLQIANTQMEEQQQQLQQQAAELQASNAQMEEQQQQLQQQTAELQAANAQMEEQQQQLQQQAAELQASNAQMEEQQQLLEQRNRELLHSQEELDTRAKQLELSSKYKSEFLANMSHELRTPLNSIILLAKMMAANEDKKLGEEEVKRAEVIHRAGQDLLRLINDVLDLSKVEAGRMELHSAPIASSDLAEEFRDLFSEPARDKGLEFTVDDAIRDTLVIDRDKLSQIVRNLLSNALKFTRSGGITLRFERRAGEALPLRISVSDSGIGVPKDKLALIFEAFQQADGSTSREYGGTGLGLSISLSFAHLMGGTIELDSTPGKGSTFTLLLPETPPAQAGQAKVQPQYRPEPVPASVPSSVAAQPGLPWPGDDRAHIAGDDQVMLLIDDDPVFAQAILDINRRQGYRTLLAPNGAEGLELAQRFRPNGILLDLGLPDMDGGTVLHQLKRTPDLAAIPVYVISARDRDNALLAQGALGYLHKPVDNQQIAAAEAEVLAKYREASGQGILLIENGTLAEQDLTPLIANEHGKIVTLSASSAQDEVLAESVAAHFFRMVIIDLGRGKAGLEAARAAAERLRQHAPGLSLMFYGLSPLSDEEDASLRPYSDSIIIKAPQAERRLQENIERFLREVPPRSHGRAAPTAPEGSGSKRLAGRHILVVDDDPRNLFVITAALEQHGARVDNALNGRRALELLAEMKPDLVVMDIMMPELDGYKTIEAMRANSRLASVPVLALTAKALPSDRAKALAAGADDYLAKPADYEVLINMAAAWCEGRR